MHIRDSDKERNMGNLKYQDITEKIIGSSFEVHNFLGNGFQEVIYQRAVIYNNISYNEFNNRVMVMIDKLFITQVG